VDRVDVAMGELWVRWVQLELGAMDAPAQPAAAAELRRRLEVGQTRRRSGGLDAEVFVRWACGEVPWLGRALGDVPAPPRPVRITRATAPAPAPSPAHEAVAARIVRGDVAR
jgi:hypothetical protein